MAYAAYLRIYEPVSAFREPDRSRWVAYADSATRPPRRDSLAVEHPGSLLTRLHILASVWAVPLATRALVYTTPMSRARRRVARGLAALRHLPAGSGDTIGEPAWGEHELAFAMYMRARSRWRAFAEFELAN